MVNKIKEKPMRKTCAKCKKSQALGNFYNANSSFFYDGKLHLCKTCVTEITENEGFEGFQSLMKMINKPIYTDLYKGDIGDYIRQMNSLPNYRSKVYEDSDMFTEAKAITSVQRAKPTDLSEEDLMDSEDFWGVGYTEQHYIYLNSEYGDYLNRYEVDSKTMENLIREICLVQLDIRVARTSKKDVKNELKAYNDLLTAANLKPVQETGAQASEMQSSFGLFIKKLEDERPVSEPDAAWKDVNNIGKYIRTYFFGNMAKMFGKENVFQDEYDEEIEINTVRPPRESED